MSQFLPKVDITDFGEDHWGLLHYTATRVEQSKGILELHTLRCNPARHQKINKADLPWSVIMGTRLRGFFRDGMQPDLAFQLGDHDDYDCLIDLEENGLLIATNSFDAVVLMPFGIRIANMLKEHKKKGEHFASFSPTAQTTKAF